MKEENYCKVLIVDDEDLIRQGIKHYIDWENEGFEIVGEASNGKEALELMETINPHIILTDMVMPLMDGEELTRIVKEKFSSVEIIILSSFSEYDYVRSTFQNGVVDYILKPKLDTQSLLDVLNVARRRIPAFEKQRNKDYAKKSVPKLLERLLSGYEVQINKNEIKQELPHSAFYLLGIKLKGTASRKSKLEKLLDLDVQDYRYYPCYLKDSYDIFLINTDKSNLLEKQLKKAAMQLATSHYFFLSKGYNDFSQTGIIYKNSFLKIIDYSFYFPDEWYITEEEWMNYRPKKENFNLDWFIDEWKQKNFDSALEYLKKHVEKMACCYTMEVSEYKAFFSNIIFNLTILLNNMGYEVKELDNTKYHYFNMIDQSHTAKDATNQLDLFLEEARKYVLHKEDQPIVPINMKRIIGYVTEHYAESLTLTDLANHFHFNPSYLSSYFSAHNNESFIEFLNRIRIEKATKLLKDGENSISEISGMVGYSDHSYFCKVFKKLKGLSPSQYRRKYQIR
ncbi:response regulator transcription factor [Niallia nealsonii]|nr:response regulator transcription factor [Niallia nealsonii]